MFSALFFGVVFLLIGFGLSFYVGKKQFYRRNVAGVEEFESYGKALALKGFEGILNLAGKISFILGAIFIIGFIIKLFLGK